MFKICLIGCGDIATHQHGPAIKLYEKLHANAIFAACCDIDQARAITFQETFNLPMFYTDIDEMLDSENPDVVSLNVPTHMTAALSCKILNRGFPLILEKPPGLDTAETLMMMKSAKDIPNCVAFNRPHMPVVGNFTKQIKPHEILDISYRMLRVSRLDPDFSTTAIHGIDLVKYITGADYKQVNFMYQEQGRSFHMGCEMENGIIASLDFLPMSGVNTERLEINTTKGLFILHLPIWAGCHDGAGKFIHYENNIETIHEIIPAEGFILGGFYRENERFFNELRQDELRHEEDLYFYEDYTISSGLQAVEIADCIRKRRKNYAKS